jgi:hypothetical protein
MKEKHPLEWAVEGSRLAENPYIRMNENCILLTNFPKDLQISQKYIEELCLKQDKTCIINKISLKEQLYPDSSYMRNKIAYVIVEFDHPKWIAPVR